MPLVVSDSKNPKKVRAGRIAARARWGEPRVVRLDSLTPEQRRLVLALIDAAKEAPASGQKASAEEVRRASDERPAA